MNMQNFIDLTSLGGDDTNTKIIDLCSKAVENNNAAICVFPTFIEIAKSKINGRLPIATVVGGFPHGQVDLEVKVLETKNAIHLGATEIDLVINRTCILDGDIKGLENEICSISEICKSKNIKLKTIIEVGELKSENNITIASEVALSNGSDFVKTSTGKAKINANLEAAEIIIKSLNNYHVKTGKHVGFKPAGGIKTQAQAKEYFDLMKSYMGADYVTPATFRIGASNLT